MELRDIEGLDEEKGIIFCGSREGWVTILTSFVRDLPSYLLDIEKYHDAGDWKSYSRKVHGMKSSFRAIGIEELSEMALDLEKHSDATDVAAVDAMHGDFIARCRHYGDAIAAILFGETPDEGQKEMASSEKIEDAYRTISEFLEFIDYDSIEMVLSSMESYRLPDEDRERFEKLSTALRRLDRKGMKAILEEVL